MRLDVDGDRFFNREESYHNSYLNDNNMDLDQHVSRYGYMDMILYAIP